MLGLKLNHVESAYWLAVDVNMINPWGHGINFSFSSTQIRILWLFTYLFSYSTDIVFDIWSQMWMDVQTIMNIRMHNMRMCIRLWTPKGSELSP